MRAKTRSRWATRRDTLKRRLTLRRWGAAATIGTVAMLAMPAFWPDDTPARRIGDIPLPLVQAADKPAPAPPSIPPEARTNRITSPSPAPGLPRAATVTVSAEPNPPIAPAPRPVAEPFAFRAKALVSDRKDSREQDCQVILIDDKVIVQASDDNRGRLFAIPYANVDSISYSQGRDPLWIGPTGTRRVAQRGGGALGMFKGSRQWLSVRTRNMSPRFVVLRLRNENEVRPAIDAFEERTGRRVNLVREVKSSD